MLIYLRRVLCAFDLNERLSNSMKLSLSRKVFLIINAFFISVMALLCLLPFLNLVALSFSSKTAVDSGKVFLWPVEFTAKTYTFVSSGSLFMNGLWISVKRVLLGTLINMFLIIITAYPLSRPDDKMYGRKIYAWFFFFTTLVSGGLIPNFILVTKLHLTNSIWALILPGALPVGSMVLMLNFFRSIPRGLEEAALIDGASPLKVVFRVILPVSKPAIATIALFCIVGHWNAWFDGMIYMDSLKLMPLQSYLRTIVKDPELQIMEAGGDLRLLLSDVNGRNSRAAQLVLGTLPILCVYPFLQKYFTKGLVIGSVKE